MINPLAPFGIPKWVHELSDLRGKSPRDWPKERWNYAKSKTEVERPVVSVVIIALNEQNGILPTLISLLENQSQTAFEIILVDNGSTDQTADYAQELGIRVVPESKKGYAFARQAGLDAAVGEVVLTGDADTIYGREWIQRMSKPLLSKPVVTCVYGIHVLVPVDGQKVSGLQFYQVAKWLSQRLKGIKRPHLNCGGASMGYRTLDAKAVGGYVNDGGRGEDGKLAWKLSSKGSISRIGAEGARIYTSMRRVDKDGNLWRAFAIRFVNIMRYFTHYFKEQKTD